MSLIQEKVNQAIEILKEGQSDVWLTFVRETSGVRDPALDLLIGPNDLTWPSALILTRQGEKIAILGNLEKDAIARLDVFDTLIGYDTAVSGPLRDTITRLNPNQIAVNTSRNNVHADGLNSRHVRDPVRAFEKYTLRRSTGQRRTHYQRPARTKDSRRIGTHSQSR